MERENVSLSVDVLRSKTPLLQLPINESLKNSFWKHVINNTDWALYKERGSKNLEFQFGLLASSSHIFLSRAIAYLSYKMTLAHWVGKFKPKLLLAQRQNYLTCTTGHDFEFFTGLFVSP